MALSDTDWQVLQWLREGRQDAEVAVRLGVNVGEARARIERIRKELGAKDRAELAASKAASEPASDADRRRPETAIPAAVPLQGSGRTFSRRTVLLAGAAGAGATVAVGAGIVALSRGGDAGSSVAAKTTPSPSASPSSTRSATAPTPHPGAAAVQPGDPGKWNRSAIQPGHEIPYAHGIGFMNTVDGGVDILSLATSSGVPFGSAYLASEYIPWLVAVDPAFVGGVVGHIFDRRFGLAFTWDWRALQLRFLHGNAVIFEALNFPGASGFEKRWFVFDTGLEPAAEISLADHPTFGQYPMALNLEGSAMAGFTVPSDRNAPLFVRTDGSAAVRGDDPEFGTPLGFLHTFSSRRDGTFRATWAPAGVGVQRLESLLYADWYSNGRLARSGVLHVSETLGQTTGQASPYSPDGRFRLGSGTFGSSYTGPGDHEDWRYTDFEVTNSSDAFRVLSGNLHYGWGEHRRWLADSSAFIIEAADPEYPRDDYWQWRLHRRYYLVAPDGSLEPLPPIPEEFRGDTNTGSWLDYWGGPEPHPDNPDLFSFGRVLLYNRATDEWFGPRNPPFADAIDPWAGHLTSPTEMRFVWPLPGKDASTPGTLLPPIVERSPFRETATFVVSGTTECLNFRERPASDSPILECLANGTLVHLAIPPLDAPYLEGINFSHDRAPAFLTLDQDDTFQMYVYVRSEAGATGWVAIQYLAWAS
jgi:DNA-binding CsgD family transcriptional regulator